MKRTTFLLPILFLFLTLAVHAGEPKIVTLKDGTRVQGRIVGIENGHYVIESPALGEIKVREDSVVSIVLPGQATDPTSASGSAPTNTPSVNAGKIQAVQSQIMSNPAIMSDMQALMQDPDVLAAMNDPAFVQAAQSGNTDAIQSSPQIQRLLNNPRIQAIMQKLQAEQQ